MNMKTIGPRKARKTRNETIEFLNAIFCSSGNDLKRCVTSYTLQTSALRRRFCVPPFVLFVFFVDKLFSPE